MSEIEVQKKAVDHDKYELVEHEQDLTYSTPVPVFGAELALLMPYVPVGIKETKKKKTSLKRFAWNYLNEHSVMFIYQKIEDFN